MRSLVFIYISWFSVSAFAFGISFLNFGTDLGMNMIVLGTFCSVVGIFVFGFNAMKDIDKEDKALQNGRNDS